MPIYKIDGVDGDVHKPKKIVTLNTIIPTSTTITKGDVLMIDTSVTTNGAGFNVIKGSGADEAVTVGVAAETITNSSSSVTLTTKIQVQVAGLNEDCTASSAAINVGELVGMANTTVESVAEGADTSYSSDHTTRPFALCVKAFTADTADGAIMIFDHGFYG
tara:strand:+ start:75 stop:560 length:486 start_codon:yes stop_codon:yes gene_type:complete